MALILCGKSGCGKSTAVEVICSEMNVPLDDAPGDLCAEFTSYMARSTTYHHYGSNRNHVDTSGMISALMSTNVQTQQVCMQFMC